MTLFSSLDLALCLLSLYVGFNHLIWKKHKKNARESIHFAILCFGIALNDAASAGAYSTNSIASGAFWQKCQFFCTVIIAVEIVNFIYALLDKKSNLIHKVLLAAIALIFLSGIALNTYVLNSQPLIRSFEALGNSVTIYEHQPGIIWNIFFITQLFGMIYLYCILLAKYFKGQAKELLPLVISFFVFFASAIFDILVSINAIRFFYSVEYSFMIMIIAMDFILRKRFVTLFNDLETLNLRLEEKVNERTAEINKIAESLALANKELEQRNSDLFELTERDSMTKLFNHAAFHRRLSEYFNLSKRQHFPICVMIIDLDYFKRINDSFGHQMGDQAILKVSETLNSNYRIYDIAGRYGGDEFAVALPYCGLKESDIVSQRMCEKIRALTFESCPELHISVSIGCAVMMNHAECENPLELMKLADRALYAAKEKGRDRAEVFSF